MLLNYCDLIPGIGAVHALRRRSFARQKVVGRNRTGDDVRFQSGQLNLDVGDSVGPIGRQARTVLLLIF